MVGWCVRTNKNIPSPVRLPYDCIGIEPGCHRRFY